MAKEKQKTMRISFPEGSIDRAISHEFFHGVCGGDRNLAGQLVSEFMGAKIEDRYGAGAESIIEATRRHLEK